VLLRSPRSGWLRIALAAPLLVFWQNCHPSVSIAALAAGVAVLVELVRRLLGRRTTFPWCELTLAMLSVAATVATPAGAEIFRIAAVNAARSRELGVDEWLPIWSLGNRASAAPAIVAVLIGARFLWANRDTVPATDLAIALALLAATIVMIRFQVFWSIALVVLLGRSWPDVPALTTDGFPRVRRYHWASALLAFAALLVAACGPSFFRTTPFIDHLPLDGIKKLAVVAETELGPGTIYNHPAWGGPLLYHGWPAWLVAYDGRYYVYSGDEWDRQHRAAVGDVALADLEAEYRPIAFFLHPQGEPGLVRQLRQSPRWRLVHEDVNCILFVPAH
jgi:hypothetical protein